MQILLANFSMKYMLPFYFFFKMKMRLDDLALHMMH